MTITVKKGESTVYHQELEDSKTMNATVACIMTMPQGNAVKTTIANNGHSLEFNTASVDVDLLIRKVNDIAVKKPAAKKTAAVEVGA